MRPLSLPPNLPDCATATAVDVAVLLLRFRVILDRSSRCLVWVEEEFFDECLFGFSLSLLPRKAKMNPLWAFSPLLLHIFVLRR